jgi:hypothetical protein
MGRLSSCAFLCRRAPLCRTDAQLAVTDAQGAVTDAQGAVAARLSSCAFLGPRAPFTAVARLYVGPMRRERSPHACPRAPFSVPVRLSRPWHAFSVRDELSWGASHGHGTLHDAPFLVVMRLASDARLAAVCSESGALPSWSWLK